MDTRTRSRRVDAQHWVDVLGKVQTTVLLLMTIYATLAGSRVGMVWLALIPGALFVLSERMTSAWHRGRPWSWYAWVILGALLLVGTVQDVFLGEATWWTAVRLAFYGLLLLLLCHPDSRARLDPRPTAAPSHTVPPSQRYRPV